MKTMTKKATGRRPKVRPVAPTVAKALAGKQARRDEGYRSPEQVRQSMELLLVRRGLTRARVRALLGRPPETAPGPGVADEAGEVVV